MGVIITTIHKYYETVYRPKNTNYNRWVQKKQFCYLLNLIPKISALQENLKLSACILDINECLFSTPICGANSICRNVPSTHNCTCEVGYKTLDLTHADCIG